MNNISNVGIVGKHTGNGGVAVKTGYRMPNNRIEKKFGVTDGRVVIPSDRVQHLYSRRIIDNKYAPKDVATMLDNALYNKKSQISHGQYKTLQATFYPNGHLVDVGIIGKNRNTPNVFIKTGYKKDLSGIKNGALDGHRVPSSDPLVRTQPTSGSRQVDNLSARQGPVADIVGYAFDFVKQCATLRAQRHQ